MCFQSSENVSQVLKWKKIKIMHEKICSDKVDVAGSRFVKNVDGNLLIEPGAVASRWKEYFSRQLNAENENQIEVSDIVSGPIKERGS